MKLKNKLAVVTGVSKGIGLATVKALLEKGVIVAGWGRTEPEIENPNFHFFQVDVGNFEQVNAAWKATSSKLDMPCHILVNNAGLGYESTFEEMEIGLWEEMFRTNVHGLFYCSKVIIPQMKVMEAGHIVNIASIAGITGIEGMAGYCGTKFAVRGISQSMFKELRKSGIKVTTINPGSVNTNFFDPIESVNANENMMRAEDVAESIIYVLQTSENYHPVELEVRPLRPKGK
ncbi:SDR family oxidoreductase [Peijinzhouia sedimentorum]